MNYTATTDLLKDRVILVTGAGSCIGAAVAKSYAIHGATVILLDKNISDLEQVYDEIIGSGGPTPAIYPLNFGGASIDDYDMLVTRIYDKLNHLDGLAHCAASIGQLAPVQYQDPLIWLATIHINLISTYFLTRSCLSLMEKSDKSSIIFTTDNHNNKAYWAGYGISKAGIAALSNQLADELESGGCIRVNCIDPGTVRTKLHVQTYPAVDPWGLLASEDVVSNYVYLMGDDSLFINGRMIKAQ
ncbi:MAG: SDR family NAD(P)-dependent oxidoreductase [Piscirickettsiaceae bacterium]|nr:SDR family NAD(P)-dependent oxidoreductase [Piscirickettsiaceae bacterium]